jgi:hypothetical protein
LRLPTRSRRPALALRMEEVRAGHPATGRLQLPVPQVGVGSWKAPGVRHGEPPRGARSRTPDADPARGFRPSRRRLPRQSPVDHPCLHRIRSGAGAAVDQTIDPTLPMIKSGCPGDLRPDRSGGERSP